MNNIVVTEEMKIRVLKNIKDTILPDVDHFNDGNDVEFIESKELAIV